MNSLQSGATSQAELEAAPAAAAGFWALGQVLPSPLSSEPPPLPPGIREIPAEPPGSGFAAGLAPNAARTARAAPSWAPAGPGALLHLLRSIFVPRPWKLPLLWKTGCLHVLACEELRCSPSCFSTGKADGKEPQERRSTPPAPTCQLFFYLSRLIPFPTRSGGGKLT